MRQKKFLKFWRSIAPLYSASLYKNRQNIKKEFFRSDETALQSYTGFYRFFSNFCTLWWRNM